MRNTTYPNFGISKNIAIILSNLGFIVHPCGWDKINKNFKKPMIKGWNDKDFEGYSQDQIENHCKENPKTIWAIRGGQGFWTADFDIYKDGFDKNHPLYLKCRKAKVKQKTPRGGLHVPIRGDYRNSTSEISTGIDTKGKGGFICLYGMLFDTRAGVNDKEDFLSLLPTTEEVFEGQRNNNLNTNNFIANKNNDKIASIQTIISGYEQGLSVEEIAKTVESSGGIPNGKAKPEVLSEKFKELCKPLKFEKGRGEYAIEFIEGMLLDYDLNGLTGEMKSAKTISLLFMLSQKLKSMPGCTFGIISTENDYKTMLEPLLEAYDASHCFKWINPQCITEGIEEYSKMEIIASAKERIEYIIKEYKFRGLLLDPLSVIVDFNKELIVSKFITSLREISKNTKSIIIFTRNEGKMSHTYKKVHVMRGTSAIPDYLRLCLVAFKCDDTSILAKRVKRKYSEKDAEGLKVSVITSQYVNSLMMPKAFVFSSKPIKININGKERKKPLWIAKYEDQIIDTNELARIEFLVSEKSGYNTTTLIEDVIKKRKRASLDEICKELSWFKEDNIRKHLETKDIFESQKDVDGTKIYFIKGSRQSLPKEPKASDVFS